MRLILLWNIIYDKKWSIQLIRIQDEIWLNCQKYHYSTISIANGLFGWVLHFSLLDLSFLLDSELNSFSNRIWYANFSPYSIGIQIFLPIFIISQCIPCCWYIICTKETFSNAWTENVQQKPSFDSYNFELLDSFDTEKTYIVWINKIILVSRSLNGH